jgi:hypothetical protein
MNQLSDQALRHASHAAAERSVAASTLQADGSLVERGVVAAFQERSSQTSADASGRWLPYWLTEGDRL